MTWFRIRSWHALRLTRSIEPVSLCGKRGAADAERRDDLPGDNSCESCLRIYARSKDRR